MIFRGSHLSTYGQYRMPELLPAKMRIPAKPKKNENWMKGFVLEPKMSEIDMISMERAQRVLDSYHKATKNKR
jgi:hypothetical protein